YNSISNQSALSFDQYFELNELKVESQEKDMVIRKLKERIISLSGNLNKDKVKKDIEDIETINIKLDHRVSKLIAENEHLKQTDKQLYDSIKPIRIRSKEQCDALINQVNLKSVEISDLHANLQEQGLIIEALRDELRKLKGKAIVDNTITTHTINPKMLKVNVEPIAPRFLNNMTFHSDYLRLQISQNPRGIFINQSKYALESLKKYGFESCDPVDTPMVEKSKLDEDREGKAVDPSHYRARHGLVRGLPKLKFEKDHLCSACAMGKSKKKPHKPKSKDTNQEKLYLLHVDLCVPMRVASVNGKKTDNGTGFVNRTLREYYKMVDISHETSVARSPQQNGAEAVATACYTQNHSIIHLRHGKTPYELLHDKLLDLSFFHVFGALCYPTNDSENLGKLQPKADIGLVPNPPPSTPFVPPSRIDWDLLFQPLFDELLTPPSSVDLPAPEVIALIAEVVILEPATSTGSPSSTTVDQGAPSPKNVSEASSSLDVIPTVVHTAPPNLGHVNK
nr:hypothetical protein [Tanacetum cinerariifolium]